MKISNIIEKINASVISGSCDADITGLTSDSRKVTAGGAFVCIMGAVSNGHTYIQDVIGRGAGLIVVSSKYDYMQHFQMQRYRRMLRLLRRTTHALHMRLCRQHGSDIRQKSCLQLELQVQKARQPQRI